MKKPLIIMVALFAMVFLAASGASAVLVPVDIDFANLVGVQMSITGGVVSFGTTSATIPGTATTVTASANVTTSNPGSLINGDPIGLTGTLTLVPTANPNIDNVTGTLGFTIFDDAKNFTANANFTGFFTTALTPSGTSGAFKGIITGFSYPSGSNALLNALLGDQTANLTLAFSDAAFTFNALQVATFFNVKEAFQGDVAAVPIPPSVLLLGSGLLGMVGLSWRRRKS